jgi:hypothetical protein
MKKLLFALLFLALPVQAQTVGIINGATPVIGGSTGQCVKQSASSVVDISDCGSGTISPDVLNLKKYTETYTAPAITSNVLTLNLVNGSVFNVASNANIATFTITGATAAKSNTFTLFMTGNNVGYTQAWGASVKWANGAAPTLTTATGKTDILTFTTNDGGTTWFAMVGGQNF